MNLIKS